MSDFATMVATSKFLMAPTDEYTRFCHSRRIINMANEMRLIVQRIEEDDKGYHDLITATPHLQTWRQNPAGYGEGAPAPYFQGPLGRQSTTGLSVEICQI